MKRICVCAHTWARHTHTHTQLFYWTVLVLQTDTVNKEYIFLRKVNKEYIPIYPKTHRLLCLLNHLSSRSSFPFPETAWLITNVQKIRASEQPIVQITQKRYEHFHHGSQSRSRPPTRRALRRIGLGNSDRYRVIRAKCYIESSKNSEKNTANLKKNVDI